MLSGKYNNEQMTLFRTLASLLSAGVPLVTALEECGEITDQKQMRDLLKRVRDTVNAGESLSAALSAESSIPMLVTSLVQTAETTGQLPQSLEQAADILDLRREWSQNVVSALIYPAVILSVTLLATLFLATTIVPQIESMYTRAGRELPLITQLAVLTARSAVVLLAVIGVYIPVSARIRRRKHTRSHQVNADAGHHRKPSLFQKIRVFRLLANLHGTALWTHALGILLAHGIPLTEALELAARIVSPISDVPEELRTVRRRIIAGESPGTAFQAVLTAPLLARRLLAGGDLAGNLSDACHRIYKIYETEYRVRAKRLTALVEPVAVVIAGCFVILAALAVILPITELGGIL
jgi:type II secretory pathway component PulF